MYWQLRNRQAMGMNGFQPIGWQDIKTWQELNIINLDTWELDALIKLDDAFMSSQNG